MFNVWRVSAVAGVWPQRERTLCFTVYPLYMILTSYVGVTGFESCPGTGYYYYYYYYFLLTYLLTYLVTYILTKLLTLLYLLAYLLTAIEFSLSGRSPHTSTDKPNKNKYT